MEINGLVGFNKLIKRAKIDVFGIPESDKTMLIRNIIYGTSFASMTIENVLIKYVWNPLQEGEQQNTETLQIDFWDIPNYRLSNYEILSYLSENGIAMVVLNVTSSIELVSLLLRRLYMTKRKCTVLFIVTHQGDTKTEDIDCTVGLLNTAIKVTQKEVINHVDIDTIDIMCPPFVVNLQSHEEISMFKSSLLIKCQTNHLITYSSGLSMLYTFVQQLRNNGNIIGSLSALQFTFLGTFNCTDDVATVADNFRYLETLGEVFLIPTIDSDDLLVMLQPLKYLQATEILISTDDDRMFKIDSRRFWPQKSLRPVPKVLATVIANCVEVRTFYDYILPIMWQNLKMADKELSQIKEILLRAAIIGRFDDDLKEHSDIGIQMPEFPSFCRREMYKVWDYTADITKSKVRNVTSSNNFRYPLRLCYNFSPLANTTTINMLIYFLSALIEKDDRRVEWISKGFSHHNDKGFVLVHSKSELTLDIEYSFNDSNSLDQFINLIKILRNYVRSALRNLKYKINGTIGDVFHREVTTTIAIDDLKDEDWKGKLLMDIDNHLKMKPDNKRPVEVSTQENVKITKDPIPKSIATPRPSDSVAGQSTKADQSQVTTKDIELSSINFSKSTCRELENVIFVKRGTVKEQLSYLKHIASSYIAVIFIQAAVEVISLQVDDQHKSLNRDPLVVAAQRDLMNISSHIASNIHSGDYETSGKIVLKVANAVQRAIKRTDQYNNPTKSRFCSIS